MIIISEVAVFLTINNRPVKNLLRQLNCQFNTHPEYRL